MVSPAPVVVKAAPAPQPKPAPPPPPIRSLTVRDRKGKLIKPSARMFSAIHRAFPVDGGAGGYWLQEVLAGRSDYPPNQGGSRIAYRPRACQRHGDRGRLYPHYYLHTEHGRRGDYRCCADCAEELRLQRRANWERYISAVPAEEEESEGDIEQRSADADSTPSAFTEARQELEAVGGALEEMPLAPEDENSLRAEIAREERANPRPVIPRVGVRRWLATG